jgi:hypothetical protein
MRSSIRAGGIGLRCRYPRQVQKSGCIIPGYSARAGPHNLGPYVADIMRTK